MCSKSPTAANLPDATWTQRFYGLAGVGSAIGGVALVVFASVLDGGVVPALAFVAAVSAAFFVASGVELRAEWPRERIGAARARV